MRGFALVCWAGFGEKLGVSMLVAWEANGGGEGITWSGKVRDRVEMVRSRRVGRRAVGEAIVVWG